MESPESPLRPAVYQELPSKLEFVAQYEGYWSVASGPSLDICVRVLECGLRPQDMARAITELQYEVALSGYRQSHVPSALRHLMGRPSYSNGRKVIMTKV